MNKYWIYILTGEKAIVKSENNIIKISWKANKNRSYREITPEYLRKYYIPITEAEYKSSLSMKEIIVNRGNFIDKLYNKSLNHKDMEKEINIAELLKDAPKGTKLYSPICGECRLVEIRKVTAYPIVVATDNCANKSEYPTFTSTGHYQNYGNGECVLFPSKECRTWENFKAPWEHKHFEPFQKVLRRHYDRWVADIYSCYVPKSRGKMYHYLISGYFVGDSFILPYEGNEDKLRREVTE